MKLRKLQQTIAWSKKIVYEKIVISCLNEGFRFCEMAFTSKDGIVVFLEHLAAEI